MNEDDSEQDNNEEAHEISADLGIFSGAALIGGTQLAYKVSKDVYSKFLKSDKKLFIQLVDSNYVHSQHRITVRLAGAHIHGIYIESICIEGGLPNDIQVFSIKSLNRISLGSMDSDDEPMTRPFLLRPGEAFDMQIRVPEQTDKAVCRKKGTKLICEFSLLDKPDNIKSVSQPVMLRWA